MKRTIATFFLVAAFAALSVFAKEENAEKTLLGIKAGINVASLNGDQAYISFGNHVVESSAKLGTQFGLFLERFYSPQFSVQIEALFSAKGTDFDANEYEQYWSLWYIEAPILFKSNFKSDNFKYSVYIGPVASLNIKSSWTAKNLDATTVDDEKLNGIRGFDLGVALGADAQTKAFGGLLVFDARYNYGTLNVQTNGAKAKNGVISLTIGYKKDIDKFFESEEDYY